MAILLPVFTAASIEPKCEALYRFISAVNQSFQLCVPALLLLLEEASLPPTVSPFEDVQPFPEDQIQVVRRWSRFLRSHRRRMVRWVR